MRSRTDTWKTIAADGEFSVESIAIIGGKEYDAITAPVIKRGLFSGSSLSVGNCVSATLTFTVMTTDTIERSAEVRIKYRISDDTLTSEWAYCGPFWVNRRTVNEDLVTLECYDAMLKGNQSYVDDSSSLNWPKPMVDVVNRCAQLMGVQLDARTVIKTGDDYKVTMPDASTTLLTILGNIAAVHGGNWIVTDDGKLRLVKLITAPVVNEYWTNEADVEITNESDQTIEFALVDEDEGASADAVNVPVVIDELLTGKPLYITRITMEYDSEVGYTTGNSEGFEILIQNNPYVSQAACDALFSELYGIMYVPYSVKNACYDPAAELGDYFIVGNRFGSILCEETRTFDISFSADATAPSESEVDNEYSYYGALDKLRDDNERLYKYADNIGRTLDSKIEQTRTSIELSVSETYTTKSDAVTSEQMYYYKSASPTQLIGGEWSRQPVEWEEGYYTWVKIRYIKGNGTYTESEPMCASGNPGLAGEPGPAGTSTYFHIKYSNTPNPEYASEMTETPSLYIGTYVDSQPGDSNDPADYTWSRFQGMDGEQGVPGQDGRDGTTYYFHIKYSDDNGATFTGNGGEDLGIYIGTLVDTIQADSTNPADYTWAKFQGQDGTSVTILGSYDTYAQLVAAHPTGTSGDSYLVDGDLYVWTPTAGTSGGWVNVGTIQGPAGTNGRDALYLYITSDASTMTPKEKTAVATLTACVGRGDSGDVDPSGSTYNYAWFITVDGGTETFYSRNKIISVIINSGLCDDRASMRFALVDADFFNLTDETGASITNEAGTALEVS